MPNWIEGSLKLRGTYNDICRFFAEGLTVYDSRWDEEIGRCESIQLDKSKWLGMEELEDGTYISIMGCHWAHVNGTKRAFVTTDHSDIYIPKKEKVDKEDKDPIQVIACEIHQAWGFVPKDWVEVSKAYHLELRAMSIEQLATWIRDQIIDRNIGIPTETWMDYLNSEVENE